MHFTGDPKTTKGENSRISVWLSESIKHTMKRDCRERLENKKIAFSKTFFTGSKSSDSDVRGALVKQLENYSIEYKAAKDSFGKPKFALSGKAYGKDDLCIVLQMLNFWPKMYIKSPSNVVTIM